MTNHHVRVVTALVNAPFVCPIFWEFATNLSLILYPNHRLFWESKLISSNQAIILTVIVLTFKDYESFRVTKSLTLLESFPILDPFWGSWENQGGGVIVTGYSGMSSVYIYTGLWTLLLLLDTDSLGAPDHRGCWDCIMCCKIISVKVWLSIVWHFLWLWLHVWHVWLSECSDPWHVSSGACSTADTADIVTMWSELVTVTNQ